MEIRSVFHVLIKKGDCHIAPEGECFKSLAKLPCVDGTATQSFVMDTIVNGVGLSFWLMKRSFLIIKAHTSSKGVAVDGPSRPFMAAQATHYWIARNVGGTRDSSSDFVSWLNLGGFIDSGVRCGLTTFFINAFLVIQVVPENGLPTIPTCLHKFDFATINSTAALLMHSFPLSLTFAWYTTFPPSFHISVTIVSPGKTVPANLTLMFLNGPYAS